MFILCRDLSTKVRRNEPRSRTRSNSKLPLTPKLKYLGVKPKYLFQSFLLTLEAFWGGQIDPPPRFFWL